MEVSSECLDRYVRMGTHLYMHPIVRLQPERGNASGNNEAALTGTHPWRTRPSVGLHLKA